MSLTPWRFITVMLAALSMTTALCHLLEMPTKLSIDAAMW